MRKENQRLRSKRMLRTGLSLLLAFILAFGHVVPLSAADGSSTESGTSDGGSAGESYPADIINLDFNEEWSEISDTIIVNSDTDITTTDNPTKSGDKCLQIYNPGSTTRNIRYGDNSKITGNQIVYECEISAPEGKAFGSRGKLFMDVNAGQYLYLLSGEVKLPDNTSLDPKVTVTSGQWTKIAMVADYEKNTFKLYVNGECVKDDGSLMKTAADGTETFRGRYVALRLDKNEGYLLVDNLRVYEGTEPHDAPTSGGDTTPDSGSDNSGSGDSGTGDGGDTSTDTPAVGDEIFTCVTFEEGFTVLGEVIGLAENEDNRKIITEANGNSYLRLETDGSATVGVTYNTSSELNQTPQYIVAECKLSTENQANNKTRVFFGKNNADSQTTTFSYVYGNSVQPNADTDLGVTLTPGTWVKVAVAINLQTHTYDLYVDGVLKGNYSFNANLNRLNTLTTRLDAKFGAGTLLVDDLKVYEGTEPREIEYDGAVGKNVYVNRTFDEIYKRDLEELIVTKNGNIAQVIAGTDASETVNKYLKLEVKDTTAVSEIGYATSDESNYLVAQAKFSLESVTGNSGILFAGSDAESNVAAFLKIEGSSVQLPDGTEVDVLAADGWKDIAVALDVRAKTYDVYVDGQMKKENLAYTGPENFSEITTAMESGSLLIDDLKVYDAKKPKTTWEVNNTPDVIYLPDSYAEGLLGDAAAIQLNANTLYANHAKSEASEPFDLSEEGKIYLALADIKTLFGADAVLNTADVKNGMYDVIAVAKANGYIYLHEMEDRMLIFGKTEITLLNEGDKETAKETNEKEVNKYLQFERPSVEEIKELFNQNVDANDGHPRVLVTQDDVDNLKRLYSSNHELIKKWGDDVIAAAEEAILTKDFTYVVTGTSMADVDATRPMILNLGMAWLLTGDERYAEKAWRMAEIICNLPDWNPAGYLDIGEFCTLIGVIYDWFYDWLEPEQKLFLEESIMEKGVGIQHKIYYQGCAPEGVYWTWWDNTNNFNAVCNGGSMVGAVAIFDKYPDICAQVISNTLHGLEYMMSSYYPEGAWFEGAGYWGYTMGYLSYTMMTFENVFGDDFGFLCSPGLEESGWFGLQLAGSTGVNNFGDTTSGHLNGKYYLWCATQFGDAELMTARIQELEKMGYTADAHELLYFDEALYNECDGVVLPLDTKIESNAIISMRERWYDENATFLGLSGFKPKSGHAHMDTGSFVVDMLGERVFKDMGANDYKADLYFSTKRYHYYRTRPEGHNVFIINPVEELDDYGGFSAWVDVPIIDDAYETEGAFAVLDLSNVYAEDTTSALRGYMLMDDRRNVVIRDEITFKEGTTNTFYSFFHTTADVEMEDENTAVLTLNGKKFKVTIATNATEYTFGPVAAEPLFDIHDLAGSSDNTGNCKLQFYTDSASGNLTFTLRITAYDDPAADITAADLHDVALAQWDTLIIQDGEITTLPALDMIYVNGEELANFDPDTTGYTGQMASSAMLPIVTASSEIYERIEVTPATDFGEDYVIKVYDNKDENTYRVYRLNYTRVPELEPIDGRVRYPVISGAQSSVNEIAPNGDYTCTIDNDFTINSRWGAQGNAYTEHWLMLELDEVSTVHKIGLGFCFGNKRYMHFKLEVSVDGENWTTVYDGLDTALTTNELNTKLQYFYDSEEGVPAKFVRYSGPGGRKTTDTTVTNYWHHISEFVVLGPKEVTEYYEQGSNEALEMIYSGTLESVKLGEETVAAENYTVTAGNASVVSLKPEYLDTLTAGTYELTLNYADGTSVGVALEILPVGSSKVEIIPEGTVGSYELKSGETVTIHATGIKDELVGVMVNDALVDPENYEVTEGSTIVTFKNTYLDSLSAGTYKVKLLYTGDRSVESSLVIEAEETTTEAEETTTEAEETTTEAEETTTEAEETTTEADETTTEAGETSTEANESTTEADESTESGTNAAPGGDPDTGDLSGAARWLWLFMAALVLMTGYAVFFGFDRKKQK